MYRYFTSGELKPRGWLRRQLQIQAEGLSGNLDKIWPDVRDSAWIGGDRDGWERVPYWLDGFIPLAYLLEDEDMIRRADRYVDAILERQCEDGWICPCTPEKRSGYDLWAVLLIGKVLAVYYEHTQSPRALDALYRAMKNLYTLLSGGEVRLFNWGKSRWYEGFIALQLLHEHYGEEWIPELGRELRRQGTDYAALTKLWERPLNKWTQQTHVVNIAMMLKYEAVSVSLLGEKYTGRAEKLWRVLEKYNGTAVGTFTGDECLSGRANNQGTELCSVVELMYSCELLYALTGDAVWADRLEKAAFNALPAAISDDMWTHQYDQMVNQIACVRFPGRSQFRTNNSEAHLFGLEPNFGCCTANFNQGWPKLAESIFLKGKKRITCGLMLPSELNTRIDGTAVRVAVDTEYPFRHSGVFTVQTGAPVEFELRIRIPGWVKAVRVNGKSCPVAGEYALRQCWSGTQTVKLELEDSPRLVKRPDGLYAAEYGPLVFSLPVEAEFEMHEYARDGVERKFPYCDYELYPRSEWRFGFGGGALAVRELPGDGYPFSSRSPRLVLSAKLYPVNWDYADGFDTVAAAKPVSSRAAGDAQTKQLYPYGCAKLRMTELPLCTGSRTK